MTLNLEHISSCATQFSKHVGPQWGHNLGTEFWMKTRVEFRRSVEAEVHNTLSLYVLLPSAELWKTMSALDSLTSMRRLDGIVRPLYLGSDFSWVKWNSMSPTNKTEMSLRNYGAPPPQIHNLGAPALEIASWVWQSYYGNCVSCSVM